MKPFAMLRLFSLILFGIRYTTSSDNPNLLFLCRKIHLPEWSTQRTFTKGFFEQIFSNLQYTNEPQQDGKTASRHTQTRTRTRTRTHTHTCLHSHVHTHTHVYTHTHSHTHIHTNTHRSVVQHAARCVLQCEHVLRQLTSRKRLPPPLPQAMALAQGS